MKKKLIHEKVSGNITGVAMEVLNELKRGVDKKFHQCAIVIELRRRGRKIDVQFWFGIFYRDQLVGNLKSHVIVADLTEDLAISGLELALLINFSSAELKWKHVVYQADVKSAPPDLYPSSFLSA